MHLDDRRLRILFYSFWIASAVLQCWLVGLSGDEAYYWRYSRELAWGYFDHPPVTALLVKAGYIIFHNELGVRLFFIVLLTLTVYGLERLIKPSDLKLFYAIVLSIAFLQVGMVWGGGMMAIPDFPLLFLELAFFILYKKYLDDNSWYVIPLIALVISLMMLTKYHAVLVVGFTVMSNLKLLKKGSLWMIVVLAIAMLIPHFIWQWDNSFPSVRYHLLERSANPYSFKYTAEYLGGQPFVLGPLMGILLIYCGIMFKPSGYFERSLKYVTIGTYLFFLVMTFKGRVEANWTIITLVPLVYMGYKQVEASKRLRTYTNYIFAFSVVIIFAARVIIITHPTIPRLERFTEALKPWTWCDEVKQRTGGLPATFINSYQRAALYEFYEGIPAFSLNNFWGRKNQYNLWDTEAQFQGKDVALISNWEMANLDTVKIAGRYYPYMMIPNFRSSSNLQIQSDLPATIHSAPGVVVNANLSFGYSNMNDRDLDANPDYPTSIQYAFFLKGNPENISQALPAIKNKVISNAERVPVTIQMPSVPGRYQLYFSASTGWLPPGFNSAAIECVIEN